MDDPYVARIEAHFSFDGRVLTRTFDWHLSRNASRKVLWELRPHPSETYVLIYAVNDPNIRFQVTPRSLIEANEEALASLQSMSNPNFTTNTVEKQLRILDDTNTVEKQLRILDDIYDSDASAVIKGEAKRQAVITLAQRYERQAVHNKALANEQRPIRFDTTMSSLVSTLSLTP